MCGLPFLLADVKMIVAGGPAPVDVLRRLARDEAAVLPEALARAGAPPSVQAVNDVGRDTASFQHKARQRRGECPAFAIGTSDRYDLASARFSKLVLHLSAYLSRTSKSHGH